MKECKYAHLYPRCNGFDGRKCPPGMLPGCFYPPKPRPKMKRIKVWAHRHNNGKMELFTIDVDKEYYNIPCTILIDRKYLKEAK